MNAAELPPHIAKALETDEPGPLDAIVREQRPEDFDVLRRIATSHQVSESFRTKALYALGRWGDRRAVPEIARVLPTLDEGGRIAAIDALGRLGGAEIVDVVAAYRDDPSPQVRKFVVKALSRVGDAKARAQLESISRDDPQEWVRKLAREHEKE
jgi:HEAT repeat protein